METIGPDCENIIYKYKQQLEKKEHKLKYKDCLYIINNIIIEEQKYNYVNVLYRKYNYKPGTQQAECILGVSVLSCGGLDSYGSIGCTCGYHESIKVVDKRHKYDNIHEVNKKKYKKYKLNVNREREWKIKIKDVNIDIRNIKIVYNDSIYRIDRYYIYYLGLKLENPQYDRESILRTLNYKSYDLCRHCGCYMADTMAPENALCKCYKKIFINNSSSIIFHKQVKQLIRNYYDFDWIHYAEY